MLHGIDLSVALRHRLERDRGHSELAADCRSGIQVLCQARATASRSGVIMNLSDLARTCGRVIPRELEKSAPTAAVYAYFLSASGDRRPQSVNCRDTYDNDGDANDYSGKRWREQIGENLCDQGSRGRLRALIPLSRLNTRSVDTGYVRDIEPRKAAVIRKGGLAPPRSRIPHRVASPCTTINPAE
jgi:hypothetical protein